MRTTYQVNKIDRSCLKQVSPAAPWGFPAANCQVLEPKWCPQLASKGWGGWQEHQASADTASWAPTAARDMTSRLLIRVASSNMQYTRQVYRMSGKAFVLKERHVGIPQSNCVTRAFLGNLLKFSTRHLLCKTTLMSFRRRGKQSGTVLMNLVWDASFFISTEFL